MNTLPEFPEGCFLDKLYKYCKTKCKAPDPIIYWTCLAFAGASIKSMVYFDMAYKRIYPNLPLLIIARSGLGKTSTVNTIQKIFKEDLPPLLPEDATAESFVKELTKGTIGDTTMGIWIIPELADVLGKKDYKQGSIAKITRLLDNPYDLTISRIKYEEVIKIKGYCLLNFIACSTFEWLMSHVEDSASTGGFIPRLGVVFCNDKSKYIEDPEANDVTEMQLRGELKVLLSQTQRRLTLIPEIKEVLKEFHKDTNECEDERVLPYKERKAENFLRLFMISQIFTSQGDDVCDISHQISLARDLSNVLENNGVRLSNSIISHNYLDLSLLKSVTKSLNRHLGKAVTFNFLHRSLRRSAHELKPMIELLHYNEMIIWNGRYGDNGTIFTKNIIDEAIILERITGGNHGLEEVGKTGSGI